MTLGEALGRNLSRVVLGSPGALAAAVIACLAGGHLLIEDVPGVGKTMLARSLAISLGGNLARIQGHPDLLPSDVTGVSVFSPADGTWQFRPGPVFADVVLFDELNRTPPRTQAALLEAMEEGQVSADGLTRPLPRPHLVLATQNPVTELGTFPLVESQRDRFALATSIGYPAPEDEARLALRQAGSNAIDSLGPVCSPAAWLDAQRATEAIPVAPAIASYAVELSRASRTAPGIRLGASPRATIWLLRAARAHAVISHRSHVVPGDVKAVAVACLAHRLVAEEGIEQAIETVRRILDGTPSPRP